MATKKDLRKYQDDFVRLYKEGYSLRKIAKMYDVSKTMISKYVKEKMDIRPKTELIKYKQEIYDKYIAGESVNRITKHFKTSSETVIKILKNDFNITVPVNRKYEELKPLLKREYVNGKSLAQISEKYNISVQSISSYLDDENINKRDYIESSHLKANVYEEYFDKISEDNMFDLGLIFALGNIYIHKTISSFVNVKISKFCEDEVLRLCSKLTEKNENNYIYTDNTPYIRILSEHLTYRLFELGLKREIPYDYLKENGFLEEFFKGYIIGSIKLTQNSLNISYVYDYTNELKRFFSEELGINDLVKTKTGLKIMNVNTVYDLLKRYNLLDRAIKYSEIKYKRNSRKIIWDKIKSLKEEEVTNY